MDRQLKATVCYVDYGESKLNIRDALAVIEGWERGFYLCVFRNDSNAQNSLVTDWPVSEDGQAYAYIAPDRLISEVNGSLSVYLDEDLNDPLAKDASAFYNFSIRTENSEDAPVYNGEIAVVTGANGERYLLPSTSRRKKVSPNSRPQETKSETVTQTPSAPAASSALSRKATGGLTKILAFAAGILLLLAMLFALWQFVLKPLLGSFLGGSPVAEQTAPVQNEEEKEEDKTENKDETEAKEDTDEALADNTAGADENNLEASEQTSAPEQNASAESTAAGDPLTTHPCDIKSSPDDKVLLDACVRSKPQDSVIYKLGQDALAQNRCDLAKRIFTSVGRGGNKDAALLLGKLFDPNESSVSSNCFAKDSRSAVYWYEKARDAGEAVESEKTLENLKNAK